MLFAIEMTDARAQQMARDFEERLEGSAMDTALTFDTGSEVHLGPVRRTGSGAFFEVSGLVHGAASSLIVTLPKTAAEADCWSNWAIQLENAGLRVSCDAGYYEYIGQMADALEGYTTPPNVH